MFGECLDISYDVVSLFLHLAHRDSDLLLLTGSILQIYSADLYKSAYGFVLHII